MCFIGPVFMLSGLIMPQGQIPGGVLSYQCYVHGIAQWSYFGFILFKGDYSIAGLSIAVVGILEVVINPEGSFSLSLGC